MNLIFEKIVAFYTDRTKKMSVKAGIAIIILIIIFFINDFSGFTYYYNINQKISNVEQINNVLSKNNLDYKTKQKLLNVQNEILNRKNVFEKTYDFISNVSFEVPFQKNENTEIKQVDNSTNEIWHFVSSSWLLMILMLGFLIAVFMDKQSTLVQGIPVLFFIEIFLFLLCSAFAYVFEFIPIINRDYMFINYFINFILHFLVLYCIYLSVKKMTK